MTRVLISGVGGAIGAHMLAHTMTVTDWDVVGVARDALLTAFVTNNVFIVLPILAEQSKGLIRKYGLEGQNSEAYVDVIIPVAFNFPTVGKLLTLLFVPFAFDRSGVPLRVLYPDNELHIAGR